MDGTEVTDGAIIVVILEDNSPIVGIIDQMWLEAAVPPVDATEVAGRAVVLGVLEAAGLPALVGILGDAGGASRGLTF